MQFLQNCFQLTKFAKTLFFNFEISVLMEEYLLLTPIKKCFGNSFFSIVNPNHELNIEILGNDSEMRLIKNFYTLNRK